ncbi:sugar ABC transporter substrate-binding protein [Mycobacterium sp.]|uniref:sugar ABC transporter substrate-binding protein n=1 Tax=Mycobacterium sp. TaxID=1785 RepID=UPI002CB59D56|nr:extracellular solute-binding protein [Mycobacterium sp.]HTH91936.1 extracellular solute-binding protein [Mycobacterium sp.]
MSRRRPVRLRRQIVALASCLALVGIAACGQQDRQSSSPTDSTCDGKLSGTIPTYITAWFHDSGANTDEAQILREQVSAFNATEQQVQVKLITLPVGDYAQQVQAAAAHGGLPDLLDFDGPNLYNYAWSGKLKPIDSCVSKSLREDLLPSIIEQGSYANRQWGVGTFDSGLGLYVRPSILTKAGIRIPSSPADAWTADEFTTVLQRLRQAGFERPLDLQLNEPNPEWYTYGFAPAVWSAGGDLIDRTDYRTVDGFLNGPGAVNAFTIMQRWFTQGYVDPNATGDAFEESRSPISWIGHWFYDRYSKAFPGDIRIVPLPNFGERTATDSGSWQWGITSNATDGDAVWRFLQFLLRPAEVLRMTGANGAIPATRSAVRISPDFAAGGPKHLYIEQLEDGVARSRPQTPAYPALSAAFARAFNDAVVQERPVGASLDAAARRVERDLSEHQYYPPPS